MIKEGTTDPDIIHDDIPMENEADSYRDKYRDYIKIFDYGVNEFDASGKLKTGNYMLEITNNKTMSDVEKKLKIIELNKQIDSYKKKVIIQEQGKRDLEENYDIHPDFKNRI